MGTLVLVPPILLPRVYTGIASGLFNAFSSLHMSLFKEYIYVYIHSIIWYFSFLYEPSVIPYGYFSAVYFFHQTVVCLRGLSLLFFLMAALYLLIYYRSRSHPSMDACCNFIPIINRNHGYWTFLFMPPVQRCVSFT